MNDLVNQVHQKKENAFVCDEFGIWDCVVIMNKNVDKRPGRSSCQVHNKLVFILYTGSKVIQHTTCQD